MNNLSKKTIYISILAIYSLIISCQPKTIYEKKEIIPNKIWEHSKTYEFEFNINEENKTYDIIIPIIYNKDIEFSELKLSFHMNIDGEDRFWHKYIELRNKNYTLMGKQREDGLYKLDFYYMKSMKLKKKGKYQFSIKNNMDLINTIGIAEIGVIVKESK